MYKKTRFLSVKKKPVLVLLHRILNMNVTGLPCFEGVKYIDNE